MAHVNRQLKQMFESTNRPNEHEREQHSVDARKPGRKFTGKQTVGASDPSDDVLKQINSELSARKSTPDKHPVAIPRKQQTRHMSYEHATFLKPDKVALRPVDIDPSSKPGPKPLLPPKNHSVKRSDVQITLSNDKSTAEQEPKKALLPVRAKISVSRSRSDTSPLCSPSTARKPPVPFLSQLSSPALTPPSSRGVSPGLSEFSSASVSKSSSPSVSRTDSPTVMTGKRESVAKLVANIHSTETLKVERRSSSDDTEAVLWGKNETSRAPTPFRKGTKAKPEQTDNGVDPVYHEITNSSAKKPSIKPAVPKKPPRTFAHDAYIQAKVKSDDKDSTGGTKPLAKDTSAPSKPKPKPLPVSLSVPQGKGIPPASPNENRPLPKTPQEQAQINAVLNRISQPGAAIASALPGPSKKSDPPTLPKSPVPPKPSLIVSNPSHVGLKQDGSSKKVPLRPPVPKDSTQQNRFSFGERVPPLGLSIQENTLYTPSSDDASSGASSTGRPVRRTGLPPRPDLPSDFSLRENSLYFRAKENRNPPNLGPPPDLTLRPNPFYNRLIRSASDETVYLTANEAPDSEYAYVSISSRPSMPRLRNNPAGAPTRIDLRHGVVSDAADVPVYADPAEMYSQIPSGGQIPSAVPLDREGYAVPILESSRNRYLRNGGQARSWTYEDAVLIDQTDPRFRQHWPQDPNVSKVTQIRKKIAAIFSTTKRPRNAESDNDEDSLVDPGEIEKRVHYMATVKNNTGKASRKYYAYVPGSTGKLFTAFLHITLDFTGNAYVPRIIRKFPQEYDEGDGVLQMCFPDSSHWDPRMSTSESEDYVFVLTSGDGQRSFGYCRRFQRDSSRVAEVLCFISPAQCLRFFTKVLAETEKQARRSTDALLKFVTGVHVKSLPPPGRPLTHFVKLANGDSENVSIPRCEDPERDKSAVLVLLQAVGPDLAVRVFASLLLERRVILVASRPDMLSKAVLGITALLYPLAWQHTLVTVLPETLLELSCSPTPFIFGLLRPHLDQLRELPTEEILICDLDNKGFLEEQEDEKTILPPRLQKALIAALNMALNGDSSDKETTVSEAFLRFFVEALGHYREHLKLTGFQQQAFIDQCGSKSLKQFLKWFSQSQMWSVFVQERSVHPNPPSDDAFEKAIDEREEDQRFWPQLKDNLRDFGRKMKKIFRGKPGVRV